MAGSGSKSSPVRLAQPKSCYILTSSRTFPPDYRHNPVLSTQTTSPRSAAPPIRLDHQLINPVPTLNRRSKPLQHQPNRRSRPPIRRNPPKRSPMARTSNDYHPTPHLCHATQIIAQIRDNQRYYTLARTSSECCFDNGRDCRCVGFGESDGTGFYEFVYDHGIGGVGWV